MMQQKVDNIQLMLVTNIYYCFQPCTLAQKNFIESLPNPVMYVDIHSYSQMWLFPYGYTTSLTADHDVLVSFFNNIM